MPHGPNYGTAESSSLVEGGYAVTDTCDVTGDCDTLVIHDSDSLPQVSQQVTLLHLMSHMIVTCGMVNTISHLCLVTVAI